MESRKRVSSAVMTALMLAAMGRGAETLFSNPKGRPERESPKEPDEKERLFLNSLDRTGFHCWKLRFQIGLTKEQREYVAKRISELTHSGQCASQAQSSEEKA